MKIKFQVKGLPPKKDGANSMWRKGSELPRLKALRLAALRALGDRPVLRIQASLEFTLYADSKAGDLDNFIAGICDGLMAAHSLTPIDDDIWNDLPPDAHPRKTLILEDDGIMNKIVAERRERSETDYRYEVCIHGE